MIALFPGSFDPYTIGHYSIVERALPLFDKIVIAVGVNRNKQSLMSEEKRVEAIRSLYESNDKVEVISYDGLTVDAAKKYGARFLLRGVRQVADFEYERNLAEVNRNISGLETILCAYQLVDSARAGKLRERRYQPAATGNETSEKTRII